MAGVAFWLGVLALAGWVVLALSGFWTAREADDLQPERLGHDRAEVVVDVLPGGWGGPGRDGVRFGSRDQPTRVNPRWQGR